MRVNEKFLTLMGIALAGVIGITLAQTLSGTSPYTLDVDLVEDNQSMEQVTVFEGDPDFLRIAPPYTNGSITYGNYLEGEKGDIQEISITPNYLDSDSIVDITAHKYDSGDSLVTSETVNFDNTTAETLGLASSINVSEDEYLQLEVYLER